VRQAARPTPTAAHVRTSLLLKIGLTGTSLIVALLIAEIALRIFAPQPAIDPRDERSLAYRYDPELGWFPRPSSSNIFTASRTIHVTHNSDGLRGPEYSRSSKPSLIFLGDSLVWGFDAEAEERFTEQIQRKHPEWAVYNFGVSGYGTDQEYLLLQRYFERYQPRVVFLMVCGDNDNEDNSWNYRGGYYKPWFSLENGRLKLNGVPVPKSEKVFAIEHNYLAKSYVLRLFAQVWCKLTEPKPQKQAEPPTGVLLLEMRKYVTEHGAHFAVGLQHSHAELRKFLEDYKIPTVDLETTNATHVYPEFGKHWTAEGHAYVAEKVNDLLLKLH
jgi:lysophospholipase L1-like esterase